jgi:hypothetical protein
MSMQVRLPANILVSKYVKSNSCFAADTGLSLHTIGYSRSRPEAVIRRAIARSYG